MSNDWVGGVQAAVANASVSLASPPSPSTDLITIGADGSVQVSAGALAGTYTLGYSLCTLNAPVNCDDAHVSVLVRSFPLVAANDQAFAAFGTGGSPVNVLTNDTLNSLPVTTSVVSLRQVSSSSPGVSLNTSTGAVNVAAGTPGGTHSLVYEACELASPINCRQATVTLLAKSIDAVNDIFPKISKDGGTSPSVLTNDRFNSTVATTATVQLSLLTPLPAGITFDLSTGRFIVADAESGDYPVTYRICEIGSSTNCDSASLTLEISGSGD